MTQKSRGLSLLPGFADSFTLLTPMANGESSNLDPESVGQAFDAAAQAAGKAQAGFLRSAEHAGYAKSVFEAAKPQFVELAKNLSTHLDAEPLVASGMAFAKASANELNFIARSTAPATNLMTLVAMSASTFASATIATSDPNSIQLRPLRALESPTFLPKDRQKYVDRLRRLDPALAKTYDAVWEALNATTADPERTAIGLMRQAFDHLMAILAPDDHVRRSPYWKQIKGEKEGLVTRNQRIEYAARTRIENQERATTIIENARNAVAAYKVLQKLHERGEVNAMQARGALETMRKFIELWVESLPAVE